MPDIPERTPLFNGTCVQVQLDRHRYETRMAPTDRDHADGHDLAAAQFYPSRGDGQGLTGTPWQSRN